jgi:hypothetical protein
MNKDSLKIIAGTSTTLVIKNNKENIPKAAILQYGSS